MSVFSDGGVKSSRGPCVCGAGLQMLLKPVIVLSGQFRVPHLNEWSCWRDRGWFECPWGWEQDSGRPGDADLSGLFFIIPGLER